MCRKGITFWLVLFGVEHLFQKNMTCVAEDGIVITSAATTTTAVPQEFLVKPTDVTVKEGERVTLPCQVKNKVGVLQWTKDKFGLGEERNLTGFTRYRMIGSDEDGNYTLEIDPVLLEDEAKDGEGPGEYQCQVAAGPGGSPPAIRSEPPAKVTVTVAPEPPIILNGNELRTVEGSEIEIKCSSNYYIYFSNM